MPCVFIHVLHERTVDGAGAKAKRQRARARERERETETEMECINVKEVACLITHERNGMECCISFVCCIVLEK